MKSLLTIFISFTIVFVVDAQNPISYLTTSTDLEISTVLNTNQQLPIFAGNDANLKAQASTLSGRTMLGLEGFNQKYNCGYFVSSNFGNPNQSVEKQVFDFSIGLSPKVKINDDFKLLFNVTLQNRNHIANVNSYVREWKLRAHFLDAGFGAGIVFRKNYFITQSHHTFGTAPLFLREESGYDLSYIGHQPYAQNLQARQIFMLGRSQTIETNLTINASISYITILDQFKDGYFLGNLTTKYKTTYFALSMAFVDNIGSGIYQAGLGFEISDRLNLACVVKGIALWEQPLPKVVGGIGASFDISKKNKQNQTLPLLTIF